MQRTVSKPSMTWMLLVALLVASGVLTAVRGLGNAQNVACSGYGYGYSYSYGYDHGYSNPAPQLSLTLSKSIALSGTTVTATGVLTQNGCVLPNQQVLIRRRAVTNMIPGGSSVTLATVYTNAAGVYTAAIAPLYNSEIKAFSPAVSGRPKVYSPARNLRLQVRIGVSAPVGSHLVPARICGRVLPRNTVGAAVYLYRGVKGVWVPKLANRVNAANIVCFSIRLPQGKTAIKLRVAATPYNLNNSRAFYVTRT